MAHDFLTELEGAAVRIGVGEETLGKMVGDRHVIQQLRDGRRMWPETAARIRSRIAEIEAERAARQTRAA